MDNTTSLPPPNPRTKPNRNNSVTLLSLHTNFCNYILRPLGLIRFSTSFPSRSLRPSIHLDYPKFIAFLPIFQFPILSLLKIHRLRVDETRREKSWLDKFRPRCRTTYRLWNVIDPIDGKVGRIRLFRDFFEKPSIKFDQSGFLKYRIWISLLEFLNSYLCFSDNSLRIMEGCRRIKVQGFSFICTYVYRMKRIYRSKTGWRYKGGGIRILASGGNP